MPPPEHQRSGTGGWCCKGRCFDPFRLFSWSTILLAAGIFSWAYYAYIVIYCHLVSDDSRPRAMAYSVVFHVLLFMCLWSYAATTVASHGSIPALYSLSAAEQRALSQCGGGYARSSLLEKLATTRGALTVDLDGSVRYCEPCRRLKPDRCHHCSSCRRCIPKMDHHCPWFNNCISFTTHKSFLLTLFYIVLLCIFSVATTADYVVRSWQGQGVTTATFHITAILFVGAIVTLGLGIFLCSHISMVFSNETTLERLRGPIFRNPEDSFDVGCCENFVQVFGHTKLLWPIPVFTATGDGVHFPTRLHPLPSAEEEERHAMADLR